MIYLIFSILSSAAIFILFKAFGQRRIDTFQAIVVNYFVAFACGFILEPIPMDTLEHSTGTWLPWAIFLGSMFILMFNLIAITTQRISVSVATISTKMSIVIPIVAAVFLYNDSMPVLKVLGIILALAGVVLASWTGERMRKTSLLFFLPIILFFGTGSVDMLLKYVQHNHLGNESPVQFSTMLFGTAAVIGAMILGARNFLKKKGMDKRSIIAGLVLGLPNFGSIYFLMKALAIPNMQSSEIFPINNMGIVLASALAAVIFFGEKGKTINRIGVAVSVVAIALIAFHSKILP